MLTGSMQLTKTFTWIGIPVSGFGFTLIKSAAEQGGSMDTGLVIVAVGTVFFVLAGTWLARGRGYSGWFGALGIFGLFGLLPLYLMSDKYECCETGGKSCKHGADKSRQDRYSRAA
jgi:hypothetical protein